MLTEGKITAAEKKTAILCLDSSSGRGGRIHLEVSVKTTLPGWGKHLCFREEGQVRQTTLYELDWHKTMESVGTIQEVVILEEYQALHNIKVAPFEWKELLVSVPLQTVLHCLVARSAKSLSRKFFHLWQGYFIVPYTVLQAAFFWFLCVNILHYNWDARSSL